jgi:hypothetical protein
MRPYRFGPRDRQGLVLGVRTSQLLIVAVVLLLIVGELRSLRSPLRLPLGFVELVAGLLAVFVPVRGRTLEAWAPVVARYASAVVGGGRRVVQLPRTAVRKPPAVFSALRVVEVAAAAEGRIGALHDRAAGTLTGVLVAAGDAFALLDEDERERRVNGWASVLAALGNGADPPFRLQWIERTVPDRRDTIRRRAAVALAPERHEASPRSASEQSARRCYDDFVASETVGALRHEILLALTVRAPRGVGGRHGRELGDASVGAGAALVRALAALHQRCGDAGLAVDGALSEDGIEGLLRRTFARAAPTTARRPWPIACEELWSAFRTDGTVHATFWIAEWPRSDVGSDFLLPLLLASGDRRALSLVMAPVESRKAVRAAEHARTSARANSELRRRHGFAQSARTNRQDDSVERREDELAAGHAGYRFSGYLVVTGESVEELERACSRVEQAAAVSRLELSRLYGAQGGAFLFGLPLGRGCA